MKIEKLSLRNVKNVLSRAELKQIMAGSGGGGGGGGGTPPTTGGGSGGCVTTGGYCNNAGLYCCSGWYCSGVGSQFASCVKIV